MFKKRLLKIINAVLAFSLAILGLESCHRKTYGQEEVQRDVIRGREMRVMYGVSPIRYQRQAEAERIIEEVIK